MTHPPSPQPWACALKVQLGKAWSWVAPALQQETLVWQALNEPTLDHAAGLGALALSQLPAEAWLWSPAGIGLLSLGQTEIAAQLRRLTGAAWAGAPNELNSLATQAYRQWTAPANSSSEAQPRTLAQACLLALALRERRRLKSDWQGLQADLLRWGTFAQPVLACLVGLVPEPESLLAGLLPEHTRLALHASLSQPVTEEAQVQSIKSLFAGLPQTAQVQMLHELAVLHPQLARRFPGLPAAALTPPDTALESGLAWKGEAATPSETATHMDAARRAGADWLAHLAALSALACQQIQNLTAAQEAWQQAYLLAPQRIDFAAALALVSIQNDNPALAQTILARLEQSTPNQPLVWLLRQWLGSLVPDSARADTPSSTMDKSLPAADKSLPGLDAWLRQALTEALLSAGLPGNALASAMNSLDTYPGHPGLLLAAAHARLIQALTAPGTAQTGGLQADSAINTAQGALQNAASRLGQMSDTPWGARPLQRRLAGYLESQARWEQALAEWEALTQAAETDDCQAEQDQLRLAYCAWRDGQPQRTVEAARQLVEVGSEATRIQAGALLGLGYLAQGKWAKAVDHLRPALRRNTLLAVLWQGLSHAYAQIGQLDRQLEALRLGCQAVPTSAGLQLALGRLLLSAGKPQEALAPLQAAVTSLSPKGDTGAPSPLAAKADCLDDGLWLSEPPIHPETVYLSLARALFDLERLPQACSVLEAACQRFPDSHELAYAYAVTCNANGHPELTIQRLQPVCTLPTAAPHLYLELRRGVLLCDPSAQAAQASRPIFTHLLAAKPTPAMIGQTQPTRADFPGLPEIDATWAPTPARLQAEAQALLGECLLREGLFEQAETAFRQAQSQLQGLTPDPVEDASDFSSWQAGLTWGRAQALVGLGQPAAAIPLLEEISAAPLPAAATGLSLPNASRLQQCLSEACLAAGQWQPAYDSAFGVLAIPQTTQSPSAGLDPQERIENTSDLDTLLWFAGHMLRLCNTPMETGATPAKTAQTETAQAGPSQAAFWAQCALQKAWQLSPDRPETLWELAEACRVTGENQLALGTYRKFAGRTRERLEALLSLPLPGSRNQLDEYQASHLRLLKWTGAVASRMRQLGDEPGETVAQDASRLSRLLTTAVNSLFHLPQASRPGDSSEARNVLLQLLLELLAAQKAAGDLEGALQAIDQILELTASTTPALPASLSLTHLYMEKIRLLQALEQQPDALTFICRILDAAEAPMQATNEQWIALRLQAASLSEERGELRLALNHARQALLLLRQSATPTTAYSLQAQACAGLQAAHLARELMLTEQARAYLNEVAEAVTTARNLQADQEAGGQPAASAATAPAPVASCSAWPFDPSEPTLTAPARALALPELDLVDLAAFQAELSLDTLTGIYQLAELEAKVQGAVNTDPGTARTLALQIRLALRQQASQSATRLWQSADARLALEAPRPQRRGLALAALEMQQWNTALELLQADVEAAPTPLAYLLVAQALCLRAEARRRCQALEVAQRAPAAVALAPETWQRFQSALQACSRLLEKDATPLSLHTPTQPAEATRLLVLWGTRGRVAFQPTAASALALQSALEGWPAGEDMYAALALAYSLVTVTTPAEQQSVSRLLNTNFREPRLGLHLALAARRHAEQTSAPAALHLAQMALQSISTASGGETAPDQALLHAFLAQQQEQANPEMALSHWQAALSLWPDEPRWHMHAAGLYLSQPEPDPEARQAAQQHLERALQIEPTQEEWVLCLAQLYCQDHDLQRAAEVLQAATQLTAGSPWLWMALAEVQHDLGDLDAADDSAEKASEGAKKAGEGAKNSEVDGEKCSPACSSDSAACSCTTLPLARLGINTRTAFDPIRAYLLRGHLALESNNPRGACNRAQNVLKIHPRHPAALLLLGQAYQALNRPELALEALNQAAELSPDNLALQQQRARLLHQIHRPDIAAPILFELSQRFPQAGLFPALLAAILIENGQTQPAVQAAQRALQAIGELPSEQAAPLHRLLARQYQRSGQLDAAVFHLCALIELLPQDLEARLDLGRAYHERRQIPLALRTYQEAVRLAPNDYRAYLQAGQALKDSKDYLQAEEMLRQAAELAPNDLSVHRLLGAVVALNLVHNHRAPLAQG